MRLDSASRPGRRRIALWAAGLAAALALAAGAWLLQAAWRDVLEYEKAFTSYHYPRRDLLKVMWHDRVLRLWLRMSSPPAGAESALPTFRLAVPQASLDALDALDAHRTRAKGWPYKAALVQLPGEDRLRPAQVRYRGDNPWHWLYEQRSWRVDLGAGVSWQGIQKFNLVNPRLVETTLTEPIVTDLCREAGVLAPRCYPVRVFLNGRYQGVHHYLDQIDGNFLRCNGRAPGSLYFGDWAPQDPLTRTSRLWTSPGDWDRKDDPGGGRKEDLEELIRTLASDDPAGFEAYARERLDLHRLAAYLALDALFGTDHHDWGHNHKLYGDPATGRLEPIMWDYGRWTDFPTLDRRGNPLVNLYKRVPALHQERLEILWGLLDRHPPGEIERRIDEIDRLITPALRADALRDHMCVAQTGCQRSVPFTMAQYDRTLGELKTLYRARHANLLRDLSGMRLTLATSPAEGGAAMDLGVRGLAAADLRRIKVDPGPDLAEGTPFRLVRVTGPDGLPGPADPVLLEGRVGAWADLPPGARRHLPGVRRHRDTARHVPHHNDAGIRILPATARTRYLLAGLPPGLQTSRVALDAVHSLDGRALPATPCDAVVEDGDAGPGGVP